MIKADINIHQEAIEYHQAAIDKINETTVEQDFYIGNSDFLDYPGNEWMKEILNKTDEEHKKEELELLYALEKHNG